MTRSHSQRHLGRYHNRRGVWNFAWGLPFAPWISTLVVLGAVAAAVVGGNLFIKHFGRLGRFAADSPVRQGVGPGTSYLPDVPSAGGNEEPYAVWLLTNVSGGSIWVGQESQLKKSRNCDFVGGGTPATAKPVAYERLSPLYDDYDGAARDYFDNLKDGKTWKPPLVISRKGVVYGRTVYVADAPTRRP